MRPGFVAVLALAVTASSLPAQTQEGPPKWLEDLEKKFPSVKKNAAAEELEKLALALGVKPSPREPEADSEAKSDLDAYQQAGFGSWMDAQIKTADDTITAPPPKLEEFLQQRRPLILRAVGLLVREVPAWEFDVRQQSSRKAWFPDVRMIVAVNRVLLSSALLEERAGHHAEAGEYLEASWSLSQSLAERPDLLSLIVAVALWKQQVGAVRKISEPPFQWSERLSNDTPRRRATTALENDTLIGYASSQNPSYGDEVERLSAGFRVLTDLLLESSPCQLSRLSREQIRERMLGVFKVETGAEPDSAEEEESPEGSSSPEQLRPDPQRAARVLMEIAAPGAIDLARRVERLIVDRELSLKILNLRQERAASRDRRWPLKLFDVASRVCPEASYEYEQRGGGMRIRFVGFFDEAGAPGLILPLSFEARPPQPTPTPARSPKTTPAPRRPAAPTASP